MTPTAGHVDAVSALRRLLHQETLTEKPGTVGLRMAWSGCDPSSPVEGFPVRARIDPLWNRSVISSGLLTRLVYTVQAHRRTELPVSVDRTWGREFHLVKVAIQIRDCVLSEVETLVMDGDFSDCQMIVGNDILQHGIVPVDVLLRYRKHLLDREPTE